MRIFDFGHRRFAIATLCILALAPGAPAIAAEAPVITVPEDPLQIVISLDAQELSLYRGETLIDTTRVSTGKRRYRTPRGVYSILEKRRRHYSNLYRRAPMPYMQRITWSGLALHQGHVPQYPASHGCIRMPKRFARSLFGMTEIGADVIITKEPQAPNFFAHENLFTQRGPAPISTARAIAETPVVRATLAAMSGVASLATPEASAAASASSASSEAVTAEAGAAIAAFGGSDGEEGAPPPEPNDDPVRVLILAVSSEMQMRPVQEMLFALGYDVGEIDGFFGRQTSRAVQAFQRDQGLAATGTFTKDTLAALYHVSGESPPSGHLYIRQGRQDVFDTPVQIRNDAERLGTHLYTAMAFEPTRRPGESVEARWTVVTIDDADGVAGADAFSALDRVTIPDAARERIETLLQPGSTVIVSDAGYGWETGKGTDFIIQPR